MLETSDLDQGVGISPHSMDVRIGSTRVGWGIFARRPYPDTAIIGEIVGKVTDDPYHASEYCFDIGDGFQLEPDPPFRFVNHSCEPNCEFDWTDDTDGSDTRNDDLPFSRHVYLIALRIIEPGEELTIDYNWPADAAIPCNCRAPSCRGWIVDENELSDIEAGDPLPSIPN